MSRILIETQYLPPIATFAHLCEADEICLEVHENYQKGSYRNRCHLVGTNGPQRLSIPLRKGKHNQRSIREVELSFDEPWHRQHWQSIKSAYGNSPYFEYYAPEVEAAYEQPGILLWEFNLRLLKIMLSALQWSKPITQSSSFEPKFLSSDGDLRGKISPKKEASESGILTWEPYPQVFTEKHGFLPNLSILDLLFCQGPAATLYLQRLVRKDNA